jgi:cleavage and polyadenylation specificity factor subunit 2
MTAIIKFQPLVGLDADQHYCFLLEIDEYKILLDCGWNYQFDTSVLDELEK